MNRGNWPSKRQGELKNLHVVFLCFVFNRFYEYGALEIIKASGGCKPTDGFN
ncbi:MAG: hypothetical protein HON53_14390 [Planctomycetaceae bacterium]|nr:hypothetical protein [Planctomycetaceae bacterium]MBT6494988.1 hypothetical protein [Planctomycetaceae bacterium]